MKFNVEYKLDLYLREEIIKVKNLIFTRITNSEVYLFGSISKGQYSKNSDIDLLILIYDKKSLKDLRLLKHLIEDDVEALKITRNVDIKIYNKDRYLELSITPCFENAILDNLINLRSW